MGGLTATLMDFFNMDQDVNLAIQVATVIIMAVVTTVTFSLRETKGVPLPENTATMPQVK